MSKITYAHKMENQFTLDNYCWFQSYFQQSVMYFCIGTMKLMEKRLLYNLKYNNYSHTSNFQVMIYDRHIKKLLNSFSGTSNLPSDASN